MGDYSEEYSETQLALLRQIRAATEGANSSNLLRLAEAFAWAVNQGQPHGGGNAWQAGGR